MLLGESPSRRSELHHFCLSRRATTNGIEKPSRDEDDDSDDNDPEDEHIDR